MAEEPPITPPPPQCWSNIVKQQKPLPNHHHPVSGGGLTAAAPDRVFVDSCKSSKGIAVAVVDATAIIQGGEKLVNCADKFVSVSEVMDEVKDPMSRHRLNFVPFTVETREPSPESLKKGLSFSGNLCTHGQGYGCSTCLDLNIELFCVLASGNVNCSIVNCPRGGGPEFSHNNPVVGPPSRALLIYLTSLFKQAELELGSFTNRAKPSLTEPSHELLVRLQPY